MDWMGTLNVNAEEVKARVPVTVIHVSGRINLGNSKAIEIAAADAYAAGSRHLLLDLQEVPSLTSAGLRSLQKIYSLMQQDAPGEGPVNPGSKSPYFKLANLSPENLQVLKMVGFDSFIDIYDSVDAGVAAF